MSQKRKHAEGIGEPNNLRKFKKQRSGIKPSRNQPHARKRSQQPKTGEDESQADSVNTVKSRIRNLKRLLGHVDSNPKNRMPQGVRIERERELETCEHELAEKQTAQRETEFRNKIIGKYHHIRFFGEC